LNKRVSVSLALAGILVLGVLAGTAAHLQGAPPAATTAPATKAPKSASALAAPPHLPAATPPAPGAPKAAATHVEGTSSAFGASGSPDWDTYLPPDIGVEGLGIFAYAGAAEPSGGVCWAKDGSGNDVFFFKNQPGEARGTFDDTQSPPTASWQDISRQVVSEARWPFSDPILHTDEQTCRTWAGHMSFPTPCTTNMAFRDEDPAALPPGDPIDNGWVPMAPVCNSDGQDHETVGSGNYSIDVPVPFGAGAYPHIVYYCTQYPTLDGCAESYDGGLTFQVYENTNVDANNLLGCAGIFGHLKVSREGYAAMPFRSCINNAGLELTRNNGLTWTALDVPGIPAADHFDPSLAWSRHADADGHSVLYFGSAQNTGVYAGVSHDFGATWTNVQKISDAYTGPNGEKITRAEFAETESGDADRAAVAFLGATYGSPSDNTDTVCPVDSHFVWYMYAARTYDGGATWHVQRVSADPVQVGGIWSAGGSSDCRNLLDFNDIALDAQGNVYVAFADGCVDTCVTGSGASTSSIGAIAAQTGGDQMRQFQENTQRMLDGINVAAAGLQHP